MRESSQVVHIEKHRIEGDLVVLTFSAEAAEQRPFVFVQHGLGSRKERHLDLCLRLAEAGFTACSLDARYHGDRATREMRGRLSDIHSADFPEAFFDTVRGTVQDIAKAATYFDLTSYGIIGHSMGGFIALQTTLADPRVSSVVSIAGALLFEISEKANHSPQILEALHQGDLIAKAAGFWPRPVLLLHGVVDETVPVQGSQRLFEALTPFYTPDSKKLHLVEFPNMGHELAPEMATDAVAWAQKFSAGA